MSKYCIECKHKEKCGMKYDAESDGMKITFCIRREINEKV